MSRLLAAGVREYPRPSRWQELGGKQQSWSKLIPAVEQPPFPDEAASLSERRCKKPKALKIPPISPSKIGSNGAKAPPTKSGQDFISSILSMTSITGLRPVAPSGSI